MTKIWYFPYKKSEKIFGQFKIISYLCIVKQLKIMKKTIQVTLSIEVDTILDKVGDIVDNLTFNINEDSENVEVKEHEVVDYFEV